MLELSPLVTAARASASDDARLLQGVTVETETDHPLAPPVHGQALERPRVFVDDRHLVALTGQDRGKLGANPPAADHHHAHGEHATRCGHVTQLVRGC